MKHNAFQSYDQHNSFYADKVDTLIQSAIDSRASSLAGVLVDNGIGAEQGITLQHGIQILMCCSLKLNYKKVSKFTTQLDVT